MGATVASSKGLVARSWMGVAGRSGGRSKGGEARHPWASGPGWSPGHRTETCAPESEPGRLSRPSLRDGVKKETQTVSQHLDPET